MTMTMTIDHHHHHHHDNDDHNYRFDHAVSGVHVITHQYYFILPVTQRHWYRQCSRLLILRSPSQHDSVVVITRIVSKVCTSDRPLSSLHSNELRGSSSWVLEKTWWPYCIRCTLSYFNTCHAGSFGNASIFSCLSHRPHWYRQCSGLPHIVRSITTRLLLCDVTPMISKFCTHDGHPMSLHYYGVPLWVPKENLSTVLYRVYTVFCFNACHTGWLDWICLTMTHVLQDILAVLQK